MTPLILDFYGAPVKLRGPREVIGFLRDDFASFEAAETAGNVAIEFELNQCRYAPPVSRGPRLFKTRLCGVYGWGRSRHCDYGAESGVDVETFPGRRRFKVYSPSDEILYELAFMAILSAAGEEIEKNGFHRVHALGLECGRAGVLLPLERGGGKSALAMNIQKLPDCRLFSDETPLLKNGVVYPFPLRLALAEDVARALGFSKGRVLRRRLFDVKEVFPFPEKFRAEPAPLKLVLAGRRATAGERAGIARTAKTKALAALASGLIVGKGVPQMAEFLLRLDALPRLTVAAAARSRETLTALHRAETFEFTMTNDAFENVETLSNFLASWVSKNVEE